MSRSTPQLSLSSSQLCPRLPVPRAHTPPPPLPPPPLSVFRQLNTAIAVSQMSSGQCRLAPLIQVIQDCSHLYHYTVKLMFRLHSCESRRPGLLTVTAALRSSLRGLAWVTGMNWIRDEKLIEVALMTSLPMNINCVLVTKNPCFPKRTLCEKSGVVDVCAGLSDAWPQQPLAAPASVAASVSLGFPTWTVQAWGIEAI